MNRYIKQFFAILSIFLIIFAVAIVSFIGISTTSQVGEGECRASYKKYLFPKQLCQYLTLGHCATTNLNKYNAEMKVSQCLCDKYLSKPSDEVENQILQKCDLMNLNCSSRVERIKLDYCNEAELDSFECNEHFSKNYVKDVAFMCENKEQIFNVILID